MKRVNRVKRGEETIRQKVRSDLIWLFIAALLIRGGTAWFQRQPNAYLDAAYYYVNGLTLAEGRGFVEDFVWNYLADPPPPPHPGHLYWLPLTSILAGLGMAIGGVGYRAAQIPFILLSAGLAPISYGVAYIWSGRRRAGWLAGLLAIFSGFYFPYWTVIDNFAPFAIAGSLALLAAWRGRERPGYLVVAGGLVGLAHLARADGPLLLIAIGLVYGWRLRRSPLSLGRIIAWLSLGYLLVMTPWFIRNWQAIGRPLPTGGTQTIWLTDYDDLFSYGREISPRLFLAQGFGPILRGRWWALRINLQTVVAVWGMIFVTPLALIGGWRLRGHLLARLAGWYALLLFTALTVVFAFPGARGGLFHSGAAVLPFIYAAGVIGLDRAVEWAARRRRHWRAGRAKQVFGAGLVLMAIGLSLFVASGKIPDWNRTDGAYPAIVAWVERKGPGATVMIGNPPAYRYYGGGLSVVTPNENITDTLRVARRYGVDYLVLEPNHPAPLDDLYRGRADHPALSLVHTLRPDSGRQIYIFEVRQ